VTLAARRLVPIIAAVVVLSPLLRAPEDDSYPLSTYPMFATDRGREAAIATAVGIGEDGSVRRLSPEAISGTDEVILAAATVSAAVRRGEVEELCDEIADRLSGSDHLAVVIRTELIDVVEHVADDAPAMSIDEHGRCEVGR
jgi:hypothetical protein